MHKLLSPANDSRRRCNRPTWEFRAAPTWPTSKWPTGDAEKGLSGRRRVAIERRSTLAAARAAALRLPTKPRREFPCQRCERCRGRRRRGPTKVGTVRFVSQRALCMAIISNFGLMVQRDDTAMAWRQRSRDAAGSIPRGSTDNLEGSRIRLVGPVC